MFNQHAANTAGLLAKTGSFSSFLLHLPLFILCSFRQCCWKWILTRVRGRPPSRRAVRSVRPAPRGFSVPRWRAIAERNEGPPFPPPCLMHLYAALKGWGLLIGDHSFCLICSCKYSNEPSWVDGVRDNGSIFYLPLLVCDSWIYLVDGIVVSKSAWFAGINFSRHSLLPCARRGERLFIYSFIISIVILWWCGINWTASTAQQFKAQYIYYKGSMPETALNRLTNQPKLRGEPYNNVTQSH